MAILAAEGVKDLGSKLKVQTHPQIAKPAFGRCSDRPYDVTKTRYLASLEMTFKTAIMTQTPATE